MSNKTKERRDRMLAVLAQLKQASPDEKSIIGLNEIENFIRDKKFGIVFEEHEEETDELLRSNLPIFTEDESKKLKNSGKNSWDFLIEGDNLQALYLLQKTHKYKIDCIYIDPPFNSGAKDWKYNNDYVDSSDLYRHSKWLSMMKVRLQAAKPLLNPDDSLLICAIDEKEHHRLGCLLDELFPEANIQMISTVINSKGVARGSEFFRVNEYLYFVRFGQAAINQLPLQPIWRGNIKTSTTEKVRWGSLMRSGSGSNREDSPGCFYPIFISEDKKHFCGVGEVVPIGVSRETVSVPEGQIAIFPIHEDGREGRWQYSREKFIELQKNGFARITTQTRSGASIRYISEGWQQRVNEGLIKVNGTNEDGSLIFDDSDYVQQYIPNNQWSIPSHNATEHGTKFLTKAIGNRFSYPKSVYAVYDALRFFVKDKPNAVILDFFAGSGTTWHAVQLLNKSDSGNRKCILATNNEVSAEEETSLKEQGFNKGDYEWESLGIAQYVTWPRIKSFLFGKNINGKDIPGNYGVTYDDFVLDEDIQVISSTTGSPLNRKVYKKTKRQIYPELKNISISEGFNANLKYFKCSWIPRYPEDFLLSNELLLHVKEMIELQNGIEIDGYNYEIIMNKDDFKRLTSNIELFSNLKTIWVNPRIILTTEEKDILKSKDCRAIPEEFFGHEMKEAGEYV